MYRKRSTKLIHIEPIGNWCADLSVTILKWILCFLFVCLLGMNLLFFANLINNAENVEYVTGVSIFKLIYCAMILTGAYLLYRSKFLEKLDSEKLEAGLLIFVATLSVIWIFMAYDIPKYDSLTVVEAAEQFMNGNYSLLAGKGSYLQRYPFQIPFVFYIEQIYKITGPGRYMLLRLLNVCYLVGIYKCLLEICGFAFLRDREKKLAIIFLYGFWQPIFLSTFIYSTIPMVLCFLLAVCKFLSYYNGVGRKKDIILAGIFLGIAILLKSNAWIYWIAFAIIIVLKIAKGSKKQVIGMLLISCIVAVAGQNLINAHYEQKSGYAIGDGTPKVLWLAMGLQEGNAAPGWYNGYPFNVLNSVDFDIKQAADIGVESVKNSIHDFINEPVQAIKFFAKKEISQWCEPTYECLNSSCHREREKPMGSLTKSIYNGPLREMLLFHFHSYQILSIFGTLFYCLRIKKGTIKIEHLVMPLTILGGFLFHTFMEAKSTYVFPYYTMMLPFSFAGWISCLGNVIASKTVTT